MSSRLKLRGHQRWRSGKPYERKSVLEKVKKFFTPSYWLGSGEVVQDDASTQTMASEDETGHVFNPPNSAGNFHSSQKPQSDVVVEDGTENEQPVPVSSAGKKNEKSSQAWKKNMIALNEDMETGPSRMFEAGSASTINPAVSTSSNVLHNTKLFIPGTLTSPQHSTPLKPSDKVATQSESDPVRANVSSEMESLPEQQEHTVSEAGKESTTSSSSAVPHMELHPSGNMLTPPDSPTPESHSVVNRRRTQSYHPTSITSPNRFNIPHGQGPLRSPYYSGRTTFGGASSQVKMRTFKRRRSNDNQTSPELPPVRQQLHARPATHQTVVASQTAKQILESLKNYSTPISNAKRFPIRSPATPLMSPKESVVPAAKRHRTKATDKQHEGVTGPPVNPLVTPYKAHVMTLPPVTPPTDDRLSSNSITMTTTPAQSTSMHSSEQPHPLATASSLSNAQQSSLTSSIPWTNELARVKEKSQDIGQIVSEGFTTGWVGGASSKGKMKEKKYTIHESKGEDEHINPMEMPKAVPLQLLSSGKLPSFSFTPAFLQKKGDNNDNDDTVSKETNTDKVPSIMSSVSVAYNFSQPKTIMTGMKPTPNKELVQYSFSMPRQCDSEAGPVAPAKPAISMPMDSVPPKMSFSSQLNPLPGTQPLLLSGSTAAVRSSERKPLPLKSGSCLDILKPSKPAAEDKDSQAEKMSTTENSLLAQKFKPAEGSWECPTCMLSNKSTNDKCVACTASKPGSAPTATANVTRASSASSASLLAQKFKPAEGAWECPACMLNNKSTDDKCVACTATRPTGLSSAPSLSSGNSGKGMTLGTGGGLQLGSGGGLKLGTMKDSGEMKASTGGLQLGSSGGLQLGSGGGLQLGSGGGLQLGSGGGLKLGNFKSDSSTVSEPSSGGFKLDSSGGFKLGLGCGLKLGSSGDLKLGSSGNLKLGSGSDSKLGTGSDFNSGGNLNLGSTNSALQTVSTQSSNLLPPSNIMVTTTIPSTSSSSSLKTQSLSMKFKPAEGSWECPACMLNNKLTDDKCVACTASKPGSASSSTEGLLSMSGPGIKLGASGGLQLGSLNNQGTSSNSSSNGNKPVLLIGQQSSSSSVQFGIKSSDTATSADKNSGLRVVSSSTGGLQLGTSGGLQLGASGGLQLGTGGLQSGLASGGFKLGQPANVQTASGEGIKFTSNTENTSATDNLGGIKLPLVNRKRPANSEEGNSTETATTNKTLVGDWMSLPPLNKPAVTTAKSVTFKLDSNITSSTSQESFPVKQPSLVGAPSGGILTGSGFTLGSSLTSSSDNKMPSTSDSSSAKPFANLFSQSSTTNPNVLGFAFAKSSAATTTASSLLNAPLSFSAGISTSTLVTATGSTDKPKLFNFSQQQSMFTAPGQGQQLTSGRLDLKLPTCQEKKEISGNVTFNFSGAKSNELSQGQQQGISGGLGVPQLNTQQPAAQPGFNFHATLQNQSGSIFGTNMGSGLTSSSTANSTLFTDQTVGVNTNQVDNASGMEISNPATGEPQHLPSLNAPTGQGFQLQFGNSNSTQPLVFNQPNTNQQSHSIFEGNSSNIFGVNNPVLGVNLPANMVFSATPSISNRPMKKARRRVATTRP